MKTSSAIVTLLFGSLATAAPLLPRALVTKTSVVVETVVVYTTVWDHGPAAPATSTPAGGNFYEQPSKPASEVKPISTIPAVVPSSVVPSVVVQKPSSKAPEPAPVQPSSVYSAPPAPVTTQAPPPKPTSVYTPPPAPSSPAPVSSAAPKPSSPPATGGGGSGETHTGDITIYDNNGGKGACGSSLTDDSMVVAMNHGLWGESTYDVMTGEATNPWCGQMITIEYKGNTIQAEVADLCPGCDGLGDIDLSLKAWKQLTGLDEKTRLQASWYKSS